MALVALAGDAPWRVAGLAGAFVVNIVVFMRLGRIWGEKASLGSIAINLLIFSSAAWLSGPSAPGAALFIPPVVAVTLLVSRGPWRNAYLIGTNLMCLGVNLSLDQGPLLTVTVTLALGGLTILLHRLRNHVDAQQQAIERERERSEKLLRAVLPERIAERIKAGEHTIADRFDDATILFCDLKGFTPLSQTMAPDDVMRMLDRLFVGFDEAIANNRVEKIKTIGDAYHVACGLDGNLNRPEDMIQLGRDMLAVVNDVNRELGTALQLRVGVSLGPVIAGVIGIDRFVFDVWGDVVNTAARMESHGVPGRIQVTQAVHDRLQSQIDFESRGKIEVKGKGPMEVFLVT
jgi:class 3 adenylate cyclase